MTTHTATGSLAGSRRLAGGLVAGLATLALAACSSDDAEQAGQAPTPTAESSVMESTPAATESATEPASESPSATEQPDFVSDALVVTDDNTVECAGNLSDGDVRSSTAAIISAQAGLTITAVRLEGTGVESIGSQGIPLEPGDLGILDFSDQWPMDFPGAENAVDLVDLRIEVGQQVLPLIGFTVTPPGELSGVVIEYVDDRGDAGAATLPFDVTLEAGPC